MIFAKRIAVLVFLVALSLLLFSGWLRPSRSSLQSLSQQVGLGEFVGDSNYGEEPGILDPVDAVVFTESTGGNSHDQVKYAPGLPKPAGQPYTRGVVMGRLAGENTTWLDEAAITDLQQYIYVVDDTSALLHTPLNKGNEAMVYLTYIIDQYDTLPDVSIFMHAHRIAWHTPELLNHDATEVLRRISSERITREGYMNLRCYWDPGCPERLHPGASERDGLKIEELAIAHAWAELFPGHPIPEALGAPCCAQFAVSRQRIQQIPKQHFIRYRDWLINTRESNWISGRVFEYLWQKIFTDQAKHCPDARICYCDSYGVCFEEADEFEHWFELNYHWRTSLKELEDWEAQAKELEEARRGGSDIETQDVAIPPAGKNSDLRVRIDEVFQDMLERRLKALEAGTEPRVRAQVAGRPWKEGDGY